ncbi:hypothetical protein L598_002500000090 [Mesorhizobium sp. J18]|uniref:hypothetical protein n=1 Tax=Mesorhizobium sp. J18 TaxID=935263 RepID=UPI00119B1FD2|nr:hypothetical protein [Mesorhizobium sp. J18]TWG96701.1 hypothetical protein L598_002500000090 [Mesorhizobium sp. J18]
MTRVLPALHEGHAPIFLHLAFQEAIEAYEDWKPGTKEPAVEFEGRLVPISSIFGRMRTCNDILPIRSLEAVRSITGDLAGEPDGREVTYAAAAFILRALCLERLKAPAIHRKSAARLWRAGKEIAR